MRLEVDVLPGLGLHQILAGDVGNVLLDLGRVAVAAAEGVGAEVVLRLSEELVEGGTAACAGVAALGINDDGIVNDVTGLEHGLEAEGGSSGIAAGVGDELLALGKVAHDLRDAVRQRRGSSWRRGASGRTTSPRRRHRGSGCQRRYR